LGRPLNQKTARKALEEHGWRATIGGKHVIKMEKEGQRPITLPPPRRQGLRQGALRRDPQAGGTRLSQRMEFHALIHEEDGSYWAEVKELPGCFASGHDLEELKEAVIEAITLYRADADAPEKTRVGKTGAHVDEMRVLVDV
jgi:predicted RNase H-like HicB family nuclease